MGDKPLEFLSVSQFAERIGVAERSLSKYQLPEPDAVIGDKARRQTRGWLPETVDAWNAKRPGRGNWRNANK